MGLTIDEDVLRQSFDLMDKNNDNCLSASEFISGFKVMVQGFLPEIVLQQTGMTMSQILPKLAQLIMTLALIFTFLAFAFAAFTGAGDSASSVIQSLIAAGAALSVKASSSKDLSGIKQAVMEQLHSVMGMEHGEGKQAKQKMADQPGKQTEEASDQVKLRRIQYPLAGNKSVKERAADDGLLAGCNYKWIEVNELVTIHAVTTPTISLKGFEWRVSPPLPTGLKVDDSSGAITGTPTKLTPLKTYTVSSGSVKTKLSFAVEHPKELQPSFAIKCTMKSAADDAFVTTFVACEHGRMYQKPEAKADGKNNENKCRLCAQGGYVVCDCEDARKSWLCEHHHQSEAAKSTSFVMFMEGRATQAKVADANGAAAPTGPAQGERSWTLAFSLDPAPKVDLKRVQWKWGSAGKLASAVIEDLQTAVPPHTADGVVKFKPSDGIVDHLQVKAELTQKQSQKKVLANLRLISVTDLKEVMRRVEANQTNNAATTASALAGTGAC